MPSLHEEPGERPRASRPKESPDYARELARAYAETKRSEDDLRIVVHDFVVELRASGASPEEAVVAVKSALRVPSVMPVRALTTDAITSRVVNWCIEDYFRGD